ncbi:MAG: ATP-binding protein [Oscillospiraceae bacterium]
MISYVKLKNYISFGEITFDFKKNKDKVKNFVAIYGENGSGKTNFISSIQLLILSLTSFTSSKTMEKLQKEIDSDLENDDILYFIKKHILNTDFTENLRKTRTIGCKEATEIEYGFKYKGHDGVYRIVYEDSILEESLRYWTGKQTGNLFKIKLDKNSDIITKFSSKLFSDKTVEFEIISEINQFWGKHTLLSIIRNKINKQNKKYVDKSYSVYLFDVLECFYKLNVITKGYSGTKAYVPENRKGLLHNLDRDVISKKDFVILERSECVINNVLSQLYADVKGAEYEYEINEDKIKYHLIIKKMIAGEVRRIDIENESTGTHQVLRILAPLIGAILGMTVVVDEIDTGIHDILFKNIIESIHDEITGQLIFTTHNTTILETIHPQNAYIITVDYNGNKEAVCLDEYNIQKTNNPRTLYLKGMFGGVPVLDNLDCDLMLAELHKSDEELNSQNEQFIKEINDSTNHTPPDSFS